MNPSRAGSLGAQTSQALCELHTQMTQGLGQSAGESYSQGFSLHSNGGYLLFGVLLGVLGVHLLKG